MAQQYRTEDWGHSDKEGCLTTVYADRIASAEVQPWWQEGHYKSKGKKEGQRK